MKTIKLLCFSLFCLMAVNLSAQIYVDLGLSSGTKWKSANEKGFYSYSSAISTFGHSVPSQEQWMELRNECDWIWSGMGYKVVGPNGNYITLPAAGGRDCSGDVYNVGTNGYYWSATPFDSGNAWFLGFDSSGVYMNDVNRCSGQSVRLVQGQ